MNRSDNEFFGKTERLGFNPLSQDDIRQRYYENFYDPKKNLFTKHSKIPPSFESSTRLLEATEQGEDFRFSVTRLDNKTKIGVCSLQDIDYLNRSGHIARFLWDKNIDGLRFGTEILRYLTYFAFDKINLNKVIVSNVASNHAAEKSCVRVGFRLEGKLRQEFYAEGKYWDVNYFGMLRDEYYITRKNNKKND